MNTSPSRPRALDEQAATWAARLDGHVLEARERTALDAWLAQSPAHRAALSAYCQLSADLEEQLPRLVAAGAVAMPAAKRKARVLTFPRIAALAFAAAAAVALGLWATRPAPPIENFATAVAQRAEHTLADGTRVELNAQTSLRFENTPDERRVRLVGGEALFTVAPDKSRPFVVQTPAGVVRVTGTTFNVRTEVSAASLDVTVLEGSVKVQPGSLAGGGSADTVALVGGERFSARSGRIATRPLSASELEDELAWRTGRVVFNEVPLAEAAARFAHYNGRSITVDPAIANEPIGGRYALEDVAGFLNFVNLTLPASARIDANGAASIVAKPRP